jgi:hypothetical protein
MVAIVAPADSQTVITALEAAGEKASVIGIIESGPRGCTVSAVAGSWASAEDWTAKHDA